MNQNNHQDSQQTAASTDGAPGAPANESSPPAQTHRHASGGPADAAPPDEAPPARPQRVRKTSFLRKRQQGRRTWPQAERGAEGIADEAAASGEMSAAGTDFRDGDGSPLPAARRGRASGPTQAGATGDARFMDVISGQFDAEQETDAVPSDVPHRRVLAPQPESPKLHKILAQAGLGSRLEMEQLIMEGRISVNNQPAHIGQRIQHGDQVRVNGKPVRFRIEPPPARIIAYHKPAGEVVTHDDPQNRPTVFRKLPRLQQGKWQSVGRLDLNTEGLLLLTSSGDVANRLMHPRFGLEREYAVRVLGTLSDEEKQRLLDGVELEDGLAQFDRIEEGGGEGANCWYRVTIREGRNREVRRMIEAVGHAVSRLIRIRYGVMVLPRGLRRGYWLELGQRDINALLQASGATGEESRRLRGEGMRNDRPGGSRQGIGQTGKRRNAPSFSRTAAGRTGTGTGTGRTASGNTASAQPDPMKTSLGYIGADSLTRKRAGGDFGPQRRNGNAVGKRRAGARRPRQG